MIQSAVVGKKDSSTMIALGCWMSSVSFQSGRGATQRNETEQAIAASVAVVVGGCCHTAMPVRGGETKLTRMTAERGRCNCGS